MLDFLKDMCRSSFKGKFNGEFDIEGEIYDIIELESGLFLDCNNGCVDQKMGHCNGSEEEQDECPGFPCIYITLTNSQTHQKLMKVWYDDSETGKFIDY